MARIRVNEDGSTQVEVYGGVNPVTGRKITHSTTVPADAPSGAVDKAVMELEERAAFTKGHPEAVTLKSLINHYLDTAELYGAAVTSVDTSRSLARCHVLPVLGKKRWTDVRREDFNALYDQMLRDGLSQKTVRRTHAMLSACFTELAKAGIIEKNPILNMRIPVGKSQEVRPLSERDLSALVDYIRRTFGGEGVDFNSQRNALAWQLALATGMRRGELAGLTSASFRRKGEVRISSALVQRTNGELIWKEPKTKTSRRVVNLDKHTSLMVEAWSVRVRRLHRSQEQFLANEDGTVWKPRDITREFKALVRELELEPTTHLHSLRHTHATYLLENGENLKTIQERLGHSSSNVTLGIYSHVMPGRDQQAADMFASITDSMADEWRMKELVPAPETCPRTGETCCMYDDYAQKNK